MVSLNGIAVLKPDVGNELAALCFILEGFWGDRALVDLGDDSGFSFLRWSLVNCFMLDSGSSPE